VLQKIVDPPDKVLDAPLCATTALRQLRISWHTHSIHGFQCDWQNKMAMPMQNVNGKLKCSGYLCIYFHFSHQHSHRSMQHNSRKRKCTSSTKQPSASDALPAFRIYGESQLYVPIVVLPAFQMRLSRYQIGCIPLGIHLIFPAASNEKFK